MKKRTVLFTLAASFSMAASTPIVIPASENAARIDRMVSQSVAECSRASHIPNYTTQLRAVFATQQPRAIALMEKRNVTICLDERLGSFDPAKSDSQSIDYLRSFNSYSLPAGSTYADRPRLFNTIADESRDTVFEKLGYYIANFGSMMTADDARKAEAMRNARANYQVQRAGQTPEGQVAVEARLLSAPNNK